MLVEVIANTSSKNDKLALVKEGLKSKEFERVLVYALDPFKIYGVRNITSMSAHGTAVFTERGTWQLLDNLISRKLTGNAARGAIDDEMVHLDPSSQELLRRIILKDLRAGFSESTVNKAKPGLIPDFPYMRCALPKDAKFGEWDWATGVFSQEKADGMFVNINVDDRGEVFLFTRNGSPIPLDTIDYLEKKIKEQLQPGTQTHGEMLVSREGKILAREVGNGVINSIIKGGSSLESDDHVFVRVWDQIPIKSAVTKGKWKEPYSRRLAALEKQVDFHVIQLVDTRIVHSLEEANRHYSEMIERGFEGTIIKNPHAIWKDTTSKDQIKLKLEVEVDLRVTGFTEGKGKNADLFGAMVAETSDGLLEVGVSGLDDDTRAKIHRERKDWADSIITVRANSIMYGNEKRKHSLFLPRFIERRDDKSEADSFQRVVDQFAAAVKPNG
jgi:DNA ligase-1